MDILKLYITLCIYHDDHCQQMGQQLGGENPTSISQPNRNIGGQ